MTQLSETVNSQVISRAEKGGVKGFLKTPPGNAGPAKGKMNLTRNFAIRMEPVPSGWMDGCCVRLDDQVFF